MTPRTGIVIGCLLACSTAFADRSTASTAQAPTAPTPAPPTAPGLPTTTTVTAAPAPPAAADPKHKSDEEEGEPKLSLPTEADRAAWRRSGFRLGLGAVYGELAGLRGAPSGRLLGAKLRVGLRLDSSWSIVSSFEYAQASRSGGLSGLRFAGTLDPTWHVLPSVAIAVGFGFGGIVEARNTGRIDAEPSPAMLETSYTFPDARTPIASCSGVGTAGLVRVEWTYVLGPRSQLAIAAEIVGQWTGCVSDTNRFEPDTGTSIVRRQWWPHAGGTLTVGFVWR